MAREILMSRAAVIRNGLIERQLTVVKAAKDCGINLSYFHELLAADKPVGYKMAGKLKKFFGEAAVEIMPAAKEGGI